MGAKNLRILLHEIILGHILVIFSEFASQKWSYFGHILAKFGHILGHILGVNLVIFWKNLIGNPDFRLGALCPVHGDRERGMSVDYCYGFI